MIIKLPLMLHNIISKQFKISHVPCKVIAFKKEEVPSKINKLITSQYDEKFLDDSDIVVFMKGPIDKKMRDKIFKACDKALGEGANMLNNTDFKLLKLKDDDQPDFGGETEEDEEKKIDDQVRDIVGEPGGGDAEDAVDDSDDNEDAVNDALKVESLTEDDDEDDEGDDEEGDDEEGTEDSSEESDDEDGDDDPNEDEDDGEAVKQVDAQTKAPDPIPTRYVFLKVSLKI